MEHVAEVTRLTSPRRQHATATTAAELPLAGEGRTVAVGRGERSYPDQRPPMTRSQLSPPPPPASSTAARATRHCRSAGRPPFHLLVPTTSRSRHRTVGDCSNLRPQKKCVNRRAGRSSRGARAPSFANLAHRRTADPSVPRTVAAQDLLSVRGVYERWRLARQIHGPALVRRDVSRLGSARPRISPPAGLVLSSARSSSRAPTRSSAFS